jgi:hypothetical protein
MPTWGNTAEHQRLTDSEGRKADWKNWGPYVSDRAWGTVREDYSADGNAWVYFPHEHARSRAYRWNEDGIGGVCNRFQNVCLAPAFWNEEDPFLKERLFGLSGPQGNHGEDVKEYYFYLDSTPTHSYMKMLYKYPQVAFPYDDLVRANMGRGFDDPEYELFDALRTPFLENRYFDIFIEYAKADEEDILCRITAYNRSQAAAPLHILPHIWFRNRWSWGYEITRPHLEDTANGVKVEESHLGTRWWYAQAANGESPDMLFTENNTNNELLYGVPGESRFVKDGINNAVVDGQMEAVNPEKFGTKAAGHFRARIAPGESYSVWVRFSPEPNARPFQDFEQIFAARQAEADAFYASFQPERLSDDEILVQRQAFAGLMWTKQFYHYSVELWLDGDPAGPKPPPSRRRGRNRNWKHLHNTDVISMPDKWEYPWYAAWDLAFHCIPIAIIDPEWAKRQLILMTREWYMHPNGQIPAYEWKFGDVNPPVHAWAALRVYQITRDLTGEADVLFLERIFHKLLLNFTWWVNRKDTDGNNVFQGGFLGLDNIGVFDRSGPLPKNGHLDQADGTAWMGMFCLNMLAIALELARTRPAYEDVATKFFEHFVYIANAIYDMGDGIGLWDENEQFFYDMMHLSDGRSIPLKVRSFVGLTPLFAVEILDAAQLEQLPSFKRRLNWFVRYRPELVKRFASFTKAGEKGNFLLSIVDQTRLQNILNRMLDTTEFLSEYGLRSLSRYHADNPYHFQVNGFRQYTVAYTPAESDNGMFGGNSNWRGPIWFPLNHLMIESLQRYNQYFGDSFKIEYPTGSGKQHSLEDVAANLSRRLIHIFLADSNDSRRAVFGGNRYFQTNPHWQNLIPFFEYFHGDNGAGLGASHQTGWTALVAYLIQQSGGQTSR